MDPDSKRQKKEPQEKKEFEEGLLFLRTLWRVGGFSKSFKFLDEIYFNLNMKFWIIGNPDLDLQKKACIRIQGIWIPEHYFILLSVSRIFFFHHAPLLSVYVSSV